MYRRIRFTRAWAVRGLVLTIALSAALVSVAGASPADDAAAVRDFRLNDAYLHRWMAIKREARTKQVKLQLFEMRGGAMKPVGSSLDTMSAHVDAEPGVHAILASHDMSARDFIIGTSVLISSRMALMSGTETSNVNPDNVAYVKAHQQEIDRFVQEDMRAQAAAH